MDAPMNIQDFVRDTLFQIASAVHEVNESFREHKLAAQANPPGGEIMTSMGSRDMPVSDTHNVEFDLAVTVARSQASTTSGTSKSELVVVGAALGESAPIPSVLSRVKFMVPLKFPRPPIGNFAPTGR
jgi:hypothetical protein